MKWRRAYLEECRASPCRYVMKWWRAYLEECRASPCRYVMKWRRAYLEECRASPCRYVMKWRRAYLEECRASPCRYVMKWRRAYLEECRVSPCPSCPWVCWPPAWSGLACRAAASAPPCSQTTNTWPRLVYKKRPSPKEAIRNYFIFSVFVNTPILDWYYV